MPLCQTPSPPRTSRTRPMLTERTRPLDKNVLRFDRRRRLTPALPRPLPGAESGHMIVAHRVRRINAKPRAGPRPADGRPPAEVRPELSERVRAFIKTPLPFL